MHDDGAVKSKLASAAIESDLEQNPTVAEVAQKAQAEVNGSTARDFFHWQPKDLMQEHMTNKKNPEAQMTWNESKKNMEPSPHLDANISEEQRQLSPPLHKNTLQGFIVCDVKGKGVQNRLTKR